MSCSLYDFAIVEPYLVNEEFVVIALLQME